jgi:HK97 family phage major capsid protein
VAALGITATWGQEQWANYVLTHLVEESALARAGARVIPVSGKSISVPRTLTDGVAAWVAELAEIPSDSPTGDVLTLTPKKAANTVVLSNESIADAPVDELNAVGTAMTRSVARALDLKAFSDDLVSATAPAGLLTASVPTVTGGVATIDPFLTAISEINSVGGRANAIIAHPDDVLVLQLLKEATGSERQLLQPDPSLPGVYSIGGVPIISTSAKDAGTALVVDGSQVVIAVSKNVEVSFSAHSKFTADAVVARIVTRTDFGWNDIRGGRLVTT